MRLNKRIRVFRIDKGRRCMISYPQRRKGVAGADQALRREALSFLSAANSLESILRRYFL